MDNKGKQPGKPGEWWGKGSNYKGAHHRHMVQNKIKHIQYTKTQCRTPLTEQVEDPEQINAITKTYQQKKQEQTIQALKQGMHNGNIPSIVADSATT